MKSNLIYYFQLFQNLSQPNPSNFPIRTKTMAMKRRITELMSQTRFVKSCYLIVFISLLISLMLPLMFLFLSFAV